MVLEDVRGFPIGMKVLAVDDNPTCLKILDGLLRKCQYQVTTTSKAITALKMLRENRNRFDLVISDVYMPDMDGFKLLELVGLEMDLPVIMLSGNGDWDLVMKGITHGACDYLVKPVRIEELRNIWQHVIRRKVESRPNSNLNTNHENSDQGYEGGEDQDEKLKRKRGDEDEDDDDDDDDEEEKGNESDDHVTKKKRRVVWSVDLHRKFVASINHLGVEKAVPKRILDYMNVDGLTRENVASHLQKYRLYLKRISSNQANMDVALGGNNNASSYMRMSPLDGLGDFRTSGRLPNATYAPAGMLSRLNSSTGVAFPSLMAPPVVQPDHNQTKPQAVVPSNYHNKNLVQGMPPSFELGKLQYGNKPNTQLTDFDPVEKYRIFPGTKLADFNSLDEPQMFTGSSTFTDPISVLVGQAGMQLPSSGTDSFNLLSSSSSLLPVGETYSYPATTNDGFSSNITKTKAVPIEAPSGGLVGDIVQHVNHSSSNQKNRPWKQNGFTTLAASALAGYGGLTGPVSHSTPNGGGSSLVETEQPNLQNGFVSNNGYGSLDDIIPGIMKRDQDVTMLMNGEFGYYDSGSSDDEEFS